jgi:hypothetical protein
MLVNYSMCLLQASLVGCYSVVHMCATHHMALPGQRFELLPCPAVYAGCQATQHPAARC